MFLYILQFLFLLDVPSSHRTCAKPTQATSETFLTRISAYARGEGMEVKIHPHALDFSRESLSLEHSAEVIGGAPPTWGQKGLMVLVAILVVTIIFSLFLTALLLLVIRRQRRRLLATQFREHQLRLLMRTQAHRSLWTVSVPQRPPPVGSSISMQMLGVESTATLVAYTPPARF
ncbi:hypothetical protein B0H10DRAFT_1949871 [Mycena sp. CBHHK59/15]|nr:hypothetical protein B0H10DRAFT_1949871 [Mycena sp. CBHHK59/15]